MEAIDKAYDYLMANDNYDGYEGQLAGELSKEKERIHDALREASYALHKAADFAGNMAEGDPDINEPWNYGGSGYIAGLKVDSLMYNRPVPSREEMMGPVLHYRDDDGMAHTLCERHFYEFGEPLEVLEPFEGMTCEECD